jgi:hypothetical protein
MFGSGPREWRTYISPLLLSANTKTQTPSIKLMFCLEEVWNLLALEGCALNAPVLPLNNG